MADFVPFNALCGNLRGLCPDCGILMHRRMSLARLSELSGALDVKILAAPSHLVPYASPSLNVDLLEP